MKVARTAPTVGEVPINAQREELPERDDSLLNRRQIRDQTIWMVSGIFVALRATNIPFRAG